MTLYELTGQYDMLMNMLYDEDIDEEVLLDTLEGMEGEIEDKADNYAKLIRNITADVESIKAEETRLSLRRKTLENRIKNLKENLQSSMEFIGKTKFKTELFSFTVANNGGEQPVEVTQILGDIPDEFLIPQDPIPDKKAIRKYLQEHGDTEFARLLPRGRHLMIR